MENWFVDWFNTSYYHTLYQHRDEAEACKFIDNLCEKLKIKQGAQILDLACGKGRHANHLAKKGFTTTGIDLANESIAEANNNAVNGAHFEVHDMRKTYRENTYDYIFNLFTSFGYFEHEKENIDVLKAVKLALKDDGIFVLDFLNVKKIIPNLIATESKKLDNILFDINRSYNGTHIIKDISVLDGTSKLYFQERVSALDLSSIEKMAKKVGLNIFDIYGNYELEDFNALTSDRLILFMK